MPMNNDTAELTRSIGKLEGQVTKLGDNLNEQKDNFTNLQKRISSIERQQSFVKGTVATLLFLGTLLGAALDHVIKWMFGR